jgi:hypothetical protein
MAGWLFLGFKCVVYGLLIINSYHFFYGKETLTSFIDQLAWLTLLGTMEYESTTLDKDYSSVWEKRIVWSVTAAAYAFIIFAWTNYIAEREWLNVVNATAWLLICAVLLWNIYGPGDPEERDPPIVKRAKLGLYMVVGACALVWTIQGEKPLDAWDAWLWIVCFLVIELNVFGFQKAAPSAIGNSPDRARPGLTGPDGA